MDCMAAIGTILGVGCDGEGDGDKNKGVIIGSAVKEGGDFNVAVDGKDFSEEVGGVDEAGEKDKAEEFWLALSFIQSRHMPIDLDFFGLTGEVARPIAHSLSTKRRGGVTVGGGQSELDQHLPTAKSGGIFHLRHRRNHHGYALAEGMEGSIVGDGRRGA